MIEETGVDGVTVARGCIGNPWIFEECRALMGMPRSDGESQSPADGSVGRHQLPIADFRFPIRADRTQAEPAGSGEGAGAGQSAAQRAVAGQHAGARTTPAERTAGAERISNVRFETSDSTSQITDPRSRNSPQTGHPSATAQSVPNAFNRPSAIGNAQWQPPSVPEQGRTIAQHFAWTVEVYGEQKAGQVMRKFGIKYSELHPHRLQVRDAFIRAKTTGDWRGVLAEWYDPGRDWPPGVCKTGPGDLVAAGAELDCAE